MVGSRIIGIRCISPNRYSMVSQIVVPFCPSVSSVSITCKEKLLAFFLGIFLRIHPLNFNFNSTMNRCLISTFLVFLIIGRDGFFVKTLIKIVDVLVTYMLSSSIKIPDKLTSLSMPLYLTHMIVK